MSNFTNITIIIELIIGILNIAIGIYKKDFYQIISGVLFLEIATNMKTIERKNRIIQVQDRILDKYFEEVKDE